MTSLYCKYFIQAVSDVFAFLFENSFLQTNLVESKGCTLPPYGVKFKLKPFLSRHERGNK